MSRTPPTQLLCVALDFRALSQKHLQKTNGSVPKQYIRLVDRFFFLCKIRYIILLIASRPWAMHKFDARRAPTARHRIASQIATISGVLYIIYVKLVPVSATSDVRARLRMAKAAPDVNEY